MIDESQPRIAFDPGRMTGFHEKLDGRADHCVLLI